MNLDSPALLKTVFALKGNFAHGATPARKLFDGIEVAPFKGNAEAAICISADFEMSWAWRGSGTETAALRGITERTNVPFILGLLREYSIPITWATVGHLFLESCERAPSGLAHKNMPRPRVNQRWAGDWYLHDPCSNLQQDPLWYAPDLVQQIMDSRTHHEIGTHSFSHIDFSAPCSTSDLIQRELEACVEAMRPFRLSPGSLVFPHNVMEYSYLPLIASAGIVAVRHRDDRVRLSYPERTSAGVYKVYESMNLRIAKHYDYREKAKIFIQKAMQRRAVYSLWFHPSDPLEIFDTQLRQILRYVDVERESGRLWVTTMRDIAGYCEARERVQVSTEQERNTLTLSFRSSLDTSKYGTPDLSVLIPTPSNPKSAWLELVNGERTPIALHPVAEGSSQFMANIPTNTKTLQLLF